MSLLVAAVVRLSISPAAANTARRRTQQIDCAATLSPPTSLTSARLTRRLAPYGVTDLPRFRGTEFRHENELADVHEVMLPGDGPRPDPWRVERWTDDAFLYRVGFKNLEDDARRVNRFVADWLDRHRGTSVIFLNNARRVMALEILDRFRWGFHDRVLDEYGARPAKRRQLYPVDYENLILSNQNSNVEVLGVTDAYVPLTASRAEIRRRTRVAMQISLDRPLHTLGPGPDGIFMVHGETPLTPRRLPFMGRVEANQRHDFTEQFWIDHGHLRVCEFARYAKVKDTPKWIDARLQLEAWHLALHLRCQLLVASHTEATFEIFRERRFTRERNLPTGRSTAEFLSTVRVDSPDFFLTLADLIRETAVH